MDTTYTNSRRDLRVTRVRIAPFRRATRRLAFLWHSLLRRAAGRRKSLAVRESVPLGDRRFVSVIEFERRRFLIGSSPASITLLCQLPDVPAGDLERNLWGETSGGKETLIHQVRDRNESGEN